MDRADRATLNGLPGFVLHGKEGTKTLAFEVSHRGIIAIYAVRNPDKVHQLWRGVTTLMPRVTAST